MYKSRSLEEKSPKDIAQYLKDRTERNKQKYQEYLVANKEEVKATA